MNKVDRVVMCQPALCMGASARSATETVWGCGLLCAARAAAMETRLSDQLRNIGTAGVLAAQAGRKKRGMSEVSRGS